MSTTDALVSDRPTGQFQAYFDNTPYPAYMWQRSGDDFRLVAYNRAAGTLSVSRIEQFIGASARSSLKNNPTMLSDLDRCDKSASVITRETDFEYPSTRLIRRLIMTFVPVFRGTVAVHTEDITDRREMESELRRGEARLTEAQRIAKIGNWEWDILDNDDWWSAELYRMLGVDPKMEKPSFATFLERVHDDDRQEFVAATERALATGSRHAMDVRIVLSDGTEKVLHSQGEISAYDGDRPIRMSGTLQDITERKQAETESHINELRFKEAQRIAKVGNWERDVVANTDWWSEELYSILEEDPQTCKPSFEAFLERVHPHDRQRVLEGRHASQAGRQASDTVEVRIVLRDGRQKIVNLRVEVRRNDKGQIETITGTLHDITERVMLEREIVAAGEHERSRIGHDLHDGLGQELTGISLGISVLARKLEGEGSAHLQALEHLQGMTQKSILETRRIAQSLSPGFWSKLGIGEALKALAQDVNEYSGVVCRVRGSAQENIQDTEVTAHLYRIAQEGVNNALRHGKAQNIELRYGQEGDTVYLAVIDDGIGIPAAHERPEGLGLRSMRYRARMINGTLTVQAGAERGTIVRCSFKHTVR